MHGYTSRQIQSQILMNTPAIEELEILHHCSLYECYECVDEIGYASMVHCQDCPTVYELLDVCEALEELASNE